MATNTNQKLAVLIDADNAQASVIQELLAEVSRYGTATIKRAYGDWTTQNLRSWKDVLHTMAIQPIQQFSYTSGKNATDSALIIDAMDVLHTGSVDGFCLVSSDSDFTRLATRIREAGLEVYGFGERKTPEPFVAACDKFIYTEILRTERTEQKDIEKAPAVAVADVRKLQPLVIAAIDANAREDGWAALGGVGSHISKMDPAFDARNYGFKKLSELVRSLKYLEVKEMPLVRPDGVTVMNVQIRMKRVA
ncbi:MAG: NYN domain-containing protein [Burkholderiales bacterium]|nr:NYN domain-containing protein [Burkholderiales bacterium]